MKHLIYIKLFLLGSLLSMFFYGCFNRNELKINKVISMLANAENKLLFKKSDAFEWEAKNIQVSFEDELKDFFFIEDSQYFLSINNIKQGIIVKIKLIDQKEHIEKVSEIMIESQYLSNGINEFLIGYQDNTPYIIY